MTISAWTNGRQYLQCTITYLFSSTLVVYQYDRLMDGIIYRRWDDIESKISRYQVSVQLKERGTVLQYCHVETTSHMGLKKKTLVTSGRNIVGQNSRMSSESLY